MMNRRDLCLLIVVILAYGTDAMTLQQLKNSGKLLRKTCLGKVGVPEEKIANIEKGEFIEEREVMCYVACIHQMFKIVTNGKLNIDAAMKQVDMMYPSDIKEPSKASLEKCRETVKKYKDLCESCFYTAKCVYEDNPKNFVFA